MGQSCVFCAIARGDAPAEVVARGDEWVAFLDVRPVFKGHVLVAPREHVPDFAALSGERLAPIFAAVQKLAGAVERGLGGDGAFVALNNKVSQSVPHLHVHVVPRKFKDGLRGFFWPRVKYASPDEAADYARRIRDALAAG
jgi:histidine triad (HIT) family protein